MECGDSSELLVSPVSSSQRPLLILELPQYFSPFLYFFTNYDFSEEHINLSILYINEMYNEI
jgi:hypothetical protein